MTQVNAFAVYALREEKDPKDPKGSEEQSAFCLSKGTCPSKDLSEFPKGCSLAVFRVSLKKRGHSELNELTSIPTLVSVNSSTPGAECNRFSSILACLIRLYGQPHRMRIAPKAWSGDGH